MENKVGKSSEPNEDCGNNLRKDETILKDECETTSNEQGKVPNTFSPIHKTSDFRQTAKYKDTESYGNQHHHSIGTGLYLTDEINDLPPRFKNKVITALKNAAAINNIPLDCDPLKLLCSIPDDSEPRPESSDSLVTLSTLPSYIKNEGSPRKALRGNSTEKESSAEPNDSCMVVGRNSTEKESFTVPNASCNLQKVNYVESIRDSQSFSIPPAPVIDRHKRNKNSFAPQDFKTNTNQHSTGYSRNSCQVLSSDSNSNKNTERSTFYAKRHPKHLPIDSISKVTKRSFEKSSNSSQISDISYQNFDLQVSTEQDSNSLFVGKSERKKFNNDYISFVKNTLDASRNPPPEDVIVSFDGRTIESKTGYKSNDSYKMKKSKKRSDSVSSVGSHTSIGKSEKNTVNELNLLPILFPDMDHNSVQNHEDVKVDSSVKYTRHENSMSQKEVGCNLVELVAKDTSEISSEREKRRKVDGELTNNRKQSGFSTRNKSNKTSVKEENEITSKFQNSQTDACFHSNKSFKSNQQYKKTKSESTPGFTNFNKKELPFKNARTSNFDKYCKTDHHDIHPYNTSSNNFSQTNQYMPSDKGTGDYSVIRQKSHDSTKNDRANSNDRSKFSPISSCKTDLSKNRRLNQNRNFASDSQTSRPSRNSLNSDFGSVKENKVESPKESSNKQYKNEFKDTKLFKSNFDESPSFKSGMSSHASTHSVNIAPNCNLSLQESTTTSVNNLPRKTSNKFSDRRLNQGTYHNLQNEKEYSKFSNKSNEYFKDDVSVSSEAFSQFSNESKNSRTKYSSRPKNIQNRNNATYSLNDDTSPKHNQRSSTAGLNDRIFNQSFISNEKNRNHNSRVCTEDGFFLKVEVSEDARNLEYWVKCFKNLFSFHFDLERCCQFAGVLTLTFDRKEEALRGLSILNTQKKEMANAKIPHVTNISTLKHRLTKPCDCRENIINDSILSIKQHASSSLNVIDKKIDEIKTSKERGKSSSKYKDLILTTDEMLKTFEDSKSNFLKLRNFTLSEVKSAANLRTIQQLKLTFIKECNTFKRCLPIYSKKEEILKAVRYFSFSVIIAETGSGKSTQLVEYLLHSKKNSNQNLIICTQPRKLAAISIAQFVSGQIGSVVGKIVGYDVGIENKCSVDTKVLYMTDYCLLKRYLRNKNLNGVSHIIIDEAHERSLYTDLLFGMLKKLLPERPDLRVIITSATINPEIFIEYFDMKTEAVVYVPGRTYPVDIVWLPETVDLKWNYVQACVEKAYEIHRKEKSGDILVFLTSPSEADEAINMFKSFYTNKDRKSSLFCLHGKSDIKEQMQVFQTTSQSIRKIIFATNVAETAVTIPGIKYVIDSGMTKELMFDPRKNKSYLAVTFISKSSAEQRKGRAGRTQSGVCYRMYSKANFCDMTENAAPDMLKTNLQKAMLKIFELGIEPESFDFIEAPPKRTISNSIDSLEYLGAIENKKLTNLGKKLVKLPLEPQLSKLIVLGVEAGIGYEAIVIAALISEAGKLFLRFEDNKIEADEKKKKFCHTGGDLCTYLEVYKRWKEINFQQRFEWCVKNFVSSKALKTVANTVREIIITLKSDLGISVSTKYSNAFKKTYERVIFDSFSENLCVSSGHAKTGYMSPFLPESFFIHPSSTLSYLGKDVPEYLVYSTLMETSRNFLFDITPISEETIKQANEAGTFSLPLHSLKCLQVCPIIMGPFGESVLIRHILGKNGSKIKDLETRIRNFTKTKNVQVDVEVDKGFITIYVGQRYHEKIAKDINEIIEQCHLEMLKEEDVIKFSGTSLHYALGAGGLISDIIMPGEFRELIVSGIKQNKCDEVETRLKYYGPLQNLNQTVFNQDCKIFATYLKVSDAQTAFSDLRETKSYNVVSKPYLPYVNNKNLPLYKLDVSWCRCPCIGTGWVDFDSEEDLVQASDMLTRSSFFLDSNYIWFSPSSHSTKELRMRNLPENADEKDIGRKLKECLPENVKPKEIKVIRKRSSQVHDTDIKAAKEKLLKLFCRFTPPTKLVIDMKRPKSDEIFWKASVYFECFDEGEEAYQSLKSNETIDSFPLSISRILKSILCCKKDVYFAISKYVKAILSDKEKIGVCEKSHVEVLESFVNIEFLCVSVVELTKMRQELMHLLQGESLDFIGISKYHFLFSESLVKTIKSIGKSTQTFISFNKFRKIITIHGLTLNIKKAKEDIYKIASNPDLSYSRIFNLLDSCIPAGFLKSIYTKYGYDLHGLVDSFELTMATIDISKNTLSLTGKKKGIKKAEQALEKMCEELYETSGKRQKVKDTQESCPICLEPVAYDFLRLEHCGHAFCRQCLLLQLESKIIPVVCVKQNCEKLIFVEDLKRIISHGDNNLKKLFCAAAMQYHVTSNIGKISYCPTPDCPMIYRVTKEGSEYNCSQCKNSICTRCKTPYHYGMSCNMFQLCQKDEDYSLKAWMKENKTDRKYCPSCNVVIEKASGCNHMECVNCKAHLCWLCLKIFPESELVYDHMPYCENNQS